MYAHHPSARPRVRRFAVATALAGVLLMSIAGLALAQSADSTQQNPAAPPATERAKPPIIVIDRFRPHDARGLNVFEPPKAETVPYTGFQLQIGAAFTQQWQDLEHKNNADPKVVAGVDQNQLIDIGPGFNTAEANLYLDAQLARGIRVQLTDYLTSRHHNESWVKDGYLLVDGSPWENAKLDKLMQYITLRLGHFEINYGDWHFRRTDNGNAMFNPLVGNMIMEPFTTEIGGELYVRNPYAFAMFCVTGGEVKGQVTKPDARSPSFISKVGFDKQLNPKLRTRLTGSVYTTSGSANNTLYSGSRSGSRYYFVMENTQATESAQAWSGDIQPGLSHTVTAWVINPFIKYQGLELFGNIEQASGHNAVETSDRDWSQYMGEGVYRFLKNQLYVAGRYDVVKGRFAGFTNDVTVDRVQAGGGMFLTQNMLAKVEYVKQTYQDFPRTDIRSGGQFDGIMVEATVAF